MKYHSSTNANVLSKIDDRQQVLLQLAQEIGLDVQALEAALQAGRYNRRLLDNEAYCQEHQIEWVPTVLWGQEKLLEGVITFSVFKDTLKTLF